MVLRTILRRLAQEESGFTLLELLIVAQIISILTAVAVPTYLQSRDDAYKATASTNVRTLVVDADLYQADNWPGSPRDPDLPATADSGFQGMTIGALQAYDASVNANDYVNGSGSEAAGVAPQVTLDPTHFCVYSQAGRWFAYQVDQTGPITTTSIAADVCT